MKKINKNQKPETVKPIAVELKETRKALKNERIRNAALRKANVNLKEDLEIARGEVTEEATKSVELINQKGKLASKLGRKELDLACEKAKPIWALIKEGRKWF